MGKCGCTRKHSLTRTYVRTHASRDGHTRMRARARAHTHTHTRTRTRAHTHTETHLGELSRDVPCEAHQQREDAGLKRRDFGISSGKTLA